MHLRIFYADGGGSGMAVMLWTAIVIVVVLAVALICERAYEARDRRRYPLPAGASTSAAGGSIFIARVTRPVRQL